jgi:hypothetical protein
MHEAAQRGMAHGTARRAQHGASTARQSTKRNQQQKLNDKQTFFTKVQNSKSNCFIASNNKPTKHAETL